MSISKEYPSSAVGYIRVSTEKQAHGDRNLEKQAESIRKACAQHRMTLHGIYEDTASGADRLGLVRRGDLKAAADLARDKRAVLVIPEPTRLFRNVEAASAFLDTYDVPIFSAREGRFVGRRALLNAVARGEVAARNIRKGTSGALGNMQADGFSFSDHPGRIKAANASAKARTEKANRLVLDIVRVIQTVPYARGLSHEAFADLLNQQGILTGRKLPWTRDGVRRPRAAAEAILAEREEIANDDSVGIPLDDMGREIPVGIAADQHAQPTTPVDPDDPEGELRKNPFFGMF